MFPCLDPLGLLVCSSRYHFLMIGEEKRSVAISGRSSHKMTGLCFGRVRSRVDAIDGRSIKIANGGSKKGT